MLEVIVSGPTKAYKSMVLSVIADALEKAGYSVVLDPTASLRSGVSRDTIGVVFYEVAETKGDGRSGAD